MLFPWVPIPLLSPPPAWPVKVSFAAGTGLSTQAAAASAVISLEAPAKLPKGTEHYISDLHGEGEAFIHLLNSASPVLSAKNFVILSCVKTCPRPSVPSLPP